MKSAILEIARDNEAEYCFIGGVMTASKLADSSSIIQPLVMNSKEPKINI